MAGKWAPLLSLMVCTLSRFFHWVTSMTESKPPQQCTILEKKLLCLYQLINRIITPVQVEWFDAFVNLAYVHGWQSKSFRSSNVNSRFKAWNFSSVLNNFCPLSFTCSLWLTFGVQYVIGIHFPWRIRGYTEATWKNALTTSLASTNIAVTQRGCALDIYRGKIQVGASLLA